jgi:hypothetical protein
MRWHASWRALLDEFRSYNERSELQGRGVAEMMDRIGGQTSQSLQILALA